MLEQADGILQVLWNMTLLDYCMKQCSKCNRVGNFVWDQDYHGNTGKWRLLDCDTERPHECSQPKKIEPERIVPCPHSMCDRRMKASELQNHVKLEHIDWGEYE